MRVRQSTRPFSAFAARQWQTTCAHHSGLVGLAAMSDPEADATHPQDYCKTEGTDLI